MSSATAATATAAMTADAATSTMTNVFAIGRYKTVLQTVETGSCTAKSTLAVPPPKPLLIARPSEAGEYPILVLLHVDISPFLRYWRLYILSGPDSTDEIKSTAAITNWLSKGLHYLLPPHVQPNINKLGLAGHSRGGKVAFALALKKEATSLKFSALIGIDPVDGMDKGKQTPPPVLTYVPHSFDLDMAAMVIGTGLGEVKKNPLFPPCAPKGVNHDDFFNECQEPACHFVAKDYGHLDLLDDDTEGLRGKTTYCLCKNGKSREPMRRFVGGIVVAFMNAYLLGDNKDLLAIKDGQKTVPVELKPIVFIGADPFAKEDWYDIKAPSVFTVKNVGKTLVTRTQGTKIASEGLKHRVFEISLADLQDDEDHAYRKIRLRAEDVQGRNVLTNFWGMDFTTDKLRSLVRKWLTLIEAHVDVKTTDNYTLRMFCIGFTKRRQNQSQENLLCPIHRKMREIMVNSASSCDLKELVRMFIPESIGKDIEKATSSIYPLQNVFIRKVKILKAPKFDLGKLMEVHGDYSEDVGVKVDRPADETMAKAPAELVGA
ncbi:hypothetical protein SO802_029733 [Lithocarpus litseifolius]|uniref:Small ribosomal subunit protein eS1 n=1 Tax=Lithocarpus litseifolius TaxID=425828 RepID=A0AAW2BXH5_9ROSI